MFGVHWESRSRADKIVGIIVTVLFYSMWGAFAYGFLWSILH